jgi:hypothetical protein
MNVSKLKKTKYVFFSCSFYLKEFYGLLAKKQNFMFKLEFKIKSRYISFHNNASLYLFEKQKRNKE